MTDCRKILGFWKRTAAVFLPVLCVIALAFPALADFRGNTALNSGLHVSRSLLSPGSSAHILAKSKNKSSTPSKPKKIPKKKLTGDPRKDALIIALSQVGYRETRKNGRQYSYYGSWASKSQASSGAPWCSEFAAWCVNQAGVPEDLYPRFTSVFEARNFYGPLGRVFAVEGGNKHSADWIREKNYSGAISLADVQPGDIILVRRNTTRSSSPSHTCMVRDVDPEKGIVYTVDGNVGGAPTKVMKRKLTIKHVYAVIKPFYELYPVKGLAAECVTEKEEPDITWYILDLNDAEDDSADGDVSAGADDGDNEEEPGSVMIHLTWEDRVGVTGYHVLRSDKPDGGYEQIKEIFDSAITSCYDEDVWPGETWYYKVIPFVETASGAQIDGSSYLKKAEKEGLKPWIKVLAVSPEPETEKKPERITDMETDDYIETEETAAEETQTQSTEIEETEIEDTEVEDTDTEGTVTEGTQVPVTEKETDSLEVPANLLESIRKFVQQSTQSESVPAETEIR